MKACLALLPIIVFTASCGALTAPDGWPVIFPGWADDPAIEPEPAPPEVVVDAPLANAGEASVPEPEPEPEPAPPTAAASAAAADAPPVVGVDPAAAPAPPPDPDPTAEPAPATPIEPPSIEATPAPVLPSAAVLDAPLPAADASAGLRLRDLFVTPEDGVVRAALVIDAAGLDHVLPARALVWTVADGPRLALPFAAVDARELFAAEDLVELSGVITALEDAGASSALKVRDEDNLLHRVVVPDAKLLVRALPALEVGVTVRLRAAPSRDDEGKVWIPAGLTVGEEKLELRNAEGLELANGICRGLVSARGLIGASISLTDAEWTGADWTFDPAAMRLVSIDLVGADKRATAPWSALPTSLGR